MNVMAVPMAMAVAMTLKYILNVAQVRPKSCHEIFCTNLRTYKMCNHIKPQVHSLQKIRPSCHRLRKQISDFHNTPMTDNLSKRRIHDAENS